MLSIEQIKRNGSNGLDFPVYSFFVVKGRDLQEGKRSPTSVVTLNDA